MRKIAFIIVFFIVFSTLSFAAGRFFVSAGAAAVFPIDSSYRDFYGQVQVSPELKAGFNVFKRVYLWLGYSFFAASFTDPVLAEKASGGQHFLAFGAGWETRPGRRLQFDFSAAMVLAALREKGLGETVREFTPGFQLVAGARYFVAKKIFITMALSFLGARITLAETENTLGGERKLGGVRLGVGLGFRF